MFDDPASVAFVYMIIATSTGFAVIMLVAKIHERLKKRRK